MPEIKTVHDVIKPSIRFYCPDCDSRMDLIGFTEHIFWCYICEQAYRLSFIRKNDIEKEDIKNVVGYDEARKDE